jgi:hypothetical protein
MTMAFTRNSPYRELGDVPFSQWYTIISNTVGPDGVVGSGDLASSATYESAKGHTALFLMLMRQESQFGTVAGRNLPRVTRNPFSFRVPDYSNEDNVKGYIHFDSYIETMVHAYDRLIDGAYWEWQRKADPYAEAETISDLLYIYAPPSDDNDTERLIAEGVRFLNSLVVTVPDGEDEVELTFGLVPHPPFKDMIVSKVGGGGFDRVPPRQIVGGVHHETMGRGSIEFYAKFFGCPDGERCDDALVDYVIGQDGRIGRLNDPRGTRSPHASGGGVALPGGLEGDGPAFVAKFGVAAINGRNVSIEYEKLNNEPLTPAQIQAGGALMAHFHDSDGQRWDEHPFTSKYGIVVSFLHWEFGTTSCGLDMEDDLAAIQAVSKGIMRQYQQSSAPTPTPTPTTPVPLPEYVPGVDVAIASRFFGMANGEDGKTYQFDPNGPVSKTWVEDSIATGEWPYITEVWVYEDGRRYFLFDGGRTYLVKDGVITRLTGAQG